MKAGKISVDGNLIIKRAESFNPQGCPRDNDGGYCGDWCPLFGEPENISEGGKDKKLQICQNRILTFDEFTDERA